MKIWGPRPSCKQARKLVKATQKLKKGCEITEDRTRDLGHRRQRINQPYHSWLLKNECACVTGYNNLRVFGRSSRHSGRTLAVERPLFWSLWNHKKIISPGITDFIVSLLSSVKSVRFPWLFTLKKMPANNKKILSLACFNKVLIGSFLIREPYDGDGNGNSTKAIGLITKTTNFARASRFFVHFFAVTARLRRENA